MIALISSVPEEGKLSIRQLKKRSVLAGKPVCKGRIHGKEVICMFSGMGKTNAAHAATLLMERFSPGMIILFGVGGAYPSSGLRVGDIAVAEKEVYGDEGVLVRQGFRGTEFMGIPLAKKGRRKYFNEFPLNRELVEKAEEASLRVTGVKSGTFVTVSTCTGTRKRAVALKRRFGAICENMEGASVAHICTLYKTPMVEIRGISNIVEDRDREKWNIGLAAENCQKAVVEFIKRNS
ncbi:MAG: futalosine hydrolase [Nitrospirae bacterium]|nr:futalosine hydrolase [Nitrospirota bacterium]MCL5420876.1 futalosine hydrolase [Nitrospirota bacterium]